MTEDEAVAPTSTEPSASTTSPPAPFKRLKTDGEEREQHNGDQMLEQEIQLLREENARLNQEIELSQERVQELERSIQAPLKPEELTVRERELLFQLVEEAKDVHNWDDCETWFEHLSEALAECPNIARAAVFCTKYDEENMTFLLQIACKHIGAHMSAVNTGPNDPLPFFEIFQMLVKTCPSALLWDYSDGSKTEEGESESRCIVAIAGGFEISHRSSFDLFVWLLDTYGWIFNLCESFAFRPHAESLLDRFHMENANGANALYLFFKSHPNFLRIQVPSLSKYEYPIFIILRDAHRVTDDMKPLFSLMASSFPEVLAMRDWDEHTPLLLACMMMGRSESPIAIANACHAVEVFLEQYPQAVFLDNDPDTGMGQSPLDCIPTNRVSCHDTLVKVLRAHFPFKPSHWPLDREDEVIRQSYKLVEEEARFGRLCVSLKSCSKIIEKFAQLEGPRDISSGLENDGDDNDCGPHVIHQIYSMWAIKHIAAISTKFESEYGRLKEELATQGAFIDL